MRSSTSTRTDEGTCRSTASTVRRTETVRCRRSGSWSWSPPSAGEPTVAAPGSRGVGGVGEVGEASPARVRLVGVGGVAFRHDLAAGLDLHLVTDDGRAAEVLEDESADGGVLVAARQPQLGGGVELVEAQVARDHPRVGARLDDAGLRAVVLVEDLADDLLGDVLEGDDAGEAPVLVDDDGQLPVVGTDLLEDAGQGSARRARRSGRTRRSRRSSSHDGRARPTAPRRSPRPRRCRRRRGR